MVCKFFLTLLLLLSCCLQMWKIFFFFFAFTFRSTKRKIQSTKCLVLNAENFVLSPPWPVEISRPEMPKALILIFFWLLRPPCLPAPSYSHLGPKSLTLSPSKLSWYLVAGGRTWSSLAHSITHRLGSVGIEFKKKRKENNF